MKSITSTLLTLTLATAIAHSNAAEPPKPNQPPRLGQVFTKDNTRVLVDRALVVYGQSLDILKDYDARIPNVTITEHQLNPTGPNAGKLVFYKQHILDDDIIIIKPDTVQYYWDPGMYAQFISDLKKTLIIDNCYWDPKTLLYPNWKHEYFTQKNPLTTPLDQLPPSYKVLEPTPKNARIITLHYGANPTPEIKAEILAKVKAVYQQVRDAKQK